MRKHLCEKIYFCIIEYNLIIRFECIIIFKKNMWPTTTSTTHTM